MRRVVGMNDPIPFPSAYPSNLSPFEREKGLRQIERFVEKGDIETAELAFDLTAWGLADGADEDQLTRLRNAAAAIGADPNPSSYGLMLGATRVSRP